MTWSRFSDDVPCPFVHLTAPQEPVRWSLRSHKMVELKLQAATQSKLEAGRHLYHHLKEIIRKIQVEVCDTVVATCTSMVNFLCQSLYTRFLFASEYCAQCIEVYAGRL